MKEDLGSGSFSFILILDILRYSITKKASSSDRSTLMIIFAIDINGRTASHDDYRSLSSYYETIVDYEAVMRDY